MTLGGVILAGGRSTRMGTPKADLDWHGVPLVLHVAGAVQAATGGPVVVVAAAGQRLPEGLTVVRDPEPDRGPLLALAAGLAALGTERAFVCGTDQPHAHEVLPALLAERDADVVAYAGQPLGALYRTRLAIEHGDGSLRGLLARVDTLELAGPTPGALRGVNTREDYEDALRRSS
jgi:molybdopterin-guanine dinucleotide biosynthesis protein A